MRKDNNIEIRENGKVLGVLLFYLFTFLPLSAQRVFTLQQLKDSALHNNIAVRNAQHGIDAAKEQRKEAFTKYFPNVQIWPQHWLPCCLPPHWLLWPTPSVCR